MKILVYGGTFNPIHKAHVNNVEIACQKFKFDKVVILPNHGGHFKDNNNLASSYDRKIMLLEAFKKCDFEVEINEIELKKDKPSYSYDTIVQLKATEPGDYYFLIGSDQAINLSKWDKIEQLKKEVTFIVSKRDNKLLKDKSLIYLDNNILDYSSTKIRTQYETSGIFEVDNYIRYKGIYLESVLDNYLQVSRKQHSINVANLARKLASKNDIDPNKAYVAGMLHDIAKELPEETQEKLAQKATIKFELKTPTYHAAAALEVITKKLKIYDLEILNAIRWHTTGFYEMSALDKLIYMSDMVSCERSFEGVKELRELLKTNLNQAFKEGFIQSTAHLKTKNVKIDDELEKLIQKVERDEV
ncbi:bis(5'-nucleosyl)-tetraphosphatase (symmetrical) YqeK [Mycoplasma sp. P36-A1]|uniref:bis(5'-nucleosyl)-tetraphosphatase (symmetrical) YqeK n=1 Tax=Mycoplasma sp. P36-A1 TaxID=3252900 RepID=UPI003C2FB2D6